jgi:YfiH family protein
MRPFEDLKERKKDIFKYTAPNLVKQDKLAHGFFTKIGGVSESVYSSLNCNTNCEDNPENIVKNQEIVCNALSFTYNNLKILDQVHSASVIIIHDMVQATSHLQADALVTNLSGILLGVKTADCVPILFFDSKNKIIAAAHAGWKGAIAGILENTILTMQNLGAEISNIIAAIGPSIQQQSYEVDQAFYHKFIEKDPLTSQFFIDSTKTTYYMFDLAKYCINKLEKIGIQTIDHLSIDTYSNPDMLFSFRRTTYENKNLGNQLECGRQLSVIGML